MSWAHLVVVLVLVVLLDLRRRKGSTAPRDVLDNMCDLSATAVTVWILLQLYYA